MGNNVVAREAKRLKGFDKRIHEIDFLRGVLIILVLVDHMFTNFDMYSTTWMDAVGESSAWYNFFKFFRDISYWYFNTKPFNDALISGDFCLRNFVRFIALFGFAFISGISSAFSRNNWARAGELLLIYGLLNVGSNMVEGSGILPVTARVQFNVIGVLAWSTLLYCFTQKSVKLIVTGTLLTFFVSWFIVPMLQYYVANGYSFFLPSFFDMMPACDWLPLFPFAFFFFLGALLSKFIYADRKSLIPHKGNWERPVCFVGRHTLIIYLSHQVIYLPLFLIINAIVMG